MNEKTLGKRCFHAILRLCIAQLMCVVLFTTISSSYENAAVISIISIIMLCIFLGVQYATLWYFGMMDRSSTVSENIKPRPLHGLAIAAISALPFAVVNFVCAALFTGGKAFFSGLFNLLNTQFFFILQQRLYDGNPAYLYFAACWMPAALIVIGMAGYILGSHNISLLMKLVYSKKIIEE